MQTPSPMGYQNSTCRIARFLAAAVTTGLFVLGASAQTPEWIWTDKNKDKDEAPQAEAGERWFRKSFLTPPYTWNARLTVAADASADVFLNGKLVASCRGWEEPVRAEVSVNLHQGDNVLAVHARGGTHRAGLLVHLNLGGTESRQIVSDASWLVATNESTGWNTLRFDSSGWTASKSLGTHGIEPWGEVLFRATATPAESFKLLPGFRAELLRSAAREEGSWVCMAFDDRGRLYVSPEGEDRPLRRFTFDERGRIARNDAVPAPVRFAMGLLFAHGSLYANALGSRGSGLYRLTDANGNDRFDPDEARLLKAFKGGGEHGYHALASGPDGKIYVLNGNVTRVPEGLSPQSPHRNYGEDILSLNPDETTRPGGALAPGCQILRTDPEGRDWELVAAGMRNAYDFDFNADGELFSYDSDNEWDWGTPWYRATRVFHCVSGAEMGWRDGTRAWADTYPDMVRGVMDIGIGSPCGVKFGTRARFPEKYRRALFLQDWSYGRILAVHLEPHGASYRGTFEEFLKGQPLNLTSMAFGPDGALYFVTGGRGTQSGLYRVTHSEASSIEPGALAPTPAGAATAGARAERRRLEAFHGRSDPAAIGTIWPRLGDADPALRYAARIALESQPVAKWLPRAQAETNATIALEAMLALARVGGRGTQEELLRVLGKFPLASLDESRRLHKLRVLQLSLARQGMSGSPGVRSLVDELLPRYPAAGWHENRELCRLLLFLKAPGTIGRTLDLVASAPSQEQQIHYIAQLRNVRDGWSSEDRRRYFGWWLQTRDHLPRPGSLLHWFHDVGRDYVDGANLNRHLETFRRDAIAALPASERESLTVLLDSPVAGAQLLPVQPRKLVQEWTLAEILPHLDRAVEGRDFERGRRALIDAQCLACHRFGNLGGGVGPELTAVGSKYGRRELIESLAEPSKVISEQFQNVRVFLKDGEDVTGRLVRDAADEVVIETDPLTRETQTVPRGRIDEIRPSTVSAMPEGLLNVLTLDEILDVLAILETGGKADAAAFQRR